MIITERFVFIHMHKTGGQTLNDVIQRCCAGCQTVGYHFPVSEIPPTAADLPLVGIVRNPWDWYVSWFAFNNRPNIQNPLFAVVSDRGRENFKTTIANLINLGSDAPASQRHRAELEEMLPETLDNNRGVGLTKDSIRNFLDNNTGYYSWLFARMLGNRRDRELHIGKFENLQDDFLKIMGALHVRETDALRLELDKRERKNSSRHSHYSHYYDSELRELVQRKEQRLIEDFDYRFDRHGPTQNTATFENSATAGGRSFKKLLGRAKNYLLLKQNFDIDAIRKKIVALPEQKWLESERERRFDVHRDTQALLLIHFEDYKYEKPEYRELYYALERELKPLIDHIAAFYQDNGFVVRLIFAKLLAGGVIPKHADGGYSLLNCHRVHIPIISDEQNFFYVGGEEKVMKVGELWEINNELMHTVENRSDAERIHLIIDWMPNHAGRPVEEVLAGDPDNGRDGQKGDAETLNLMVAEAYQAHRTGKARRAESLYRQVLDIDPDHIACNNLLGLLCIQTKRPEQAVSYISLALKIEPNDAPAHSNLALAFKDLRRFDEAAHHFELAAQLMPNDPKKHNNLGNSYMALDRFDDAIASYQQALVAQPNYVEALHNLGRAFMQVSRFDEAVSVFQRSLDLKPNFHESRQLLDKALARMKSVENESGAIS